MDIKFIRFHSAVETDLQTGRRFYNCQQNGVGEYFIDSLLADIESFYGNYLIEVDDGFKRIIGTGAETETG